LSQSTFSESEKLVRVKAVTMKLTTGAYLIFFLSLAGCAVASADEIKIRCPSEGLFYAPPLKDGDLPCPMFLKEKTREVEVSDPPRKDGFWLITCHIDVGGALVALNVQMGGTRKCSFLSQAVSTLKTGGQVCVVDVGSDQCLIVCH